MPGEFYQYYQKTVIPALQEQHGYKNVHQVPKVQKVVVNTCVNANTDVKQRAWKTRRRKWRSSPARSPPRPARRRASRISSSASTRPSARRSRCAAPGCMSSSSVSSRRPCRAFAIFAASRPRRLTATAITPSASPTRSIFPEVELDKIKRNIGFDVTIVTTARTNEEAKSLLTELGMPFSDKARLPAAKESGGGSPAA